MSKVNLFTLAGQLAATLNSLYRGIRYDQAQLLEFMDVNCWFGITPSIFDKSPYITPGESERILDSLTLWLSAFKQPDIISWICCYDDLSRFTRKHAGFTVSILP